MLLLTNCVNNSFLLSLFGWAQLRMTTFGPSFPGFPTGPLTPGSPCLNNKSHVIKRIISQEYFRILYCIEQSVPSTVPFLPLCPRLLARLATPSPPFVREARGLWSGTRCRHSVSTGETGGKSGGTVKISSSWTRALRFCPLLCHVPWVEDTTPTDTKYSLNVCGAEIMWSHQRRLQEHPSSRWVVNFVKLIDCDI